MRISQKTGTLEILVQNWLPGGLYRKYSLLAGFPENAQTQIKKLELPAEPISMKIEVG